MADYERHRKEGLRLHDLGLYNQAVEEYEKARVCKPDPSLIMLIVSSRICQGRLPEAIAEMDRAGNIDSLALENESFRNRLKMAKAFTTSIHTMKVSAQLEMVAHLYEQHLAPRTPHLLTKEEVSLTWPIYVYMKYPI